MNREKIKRASLQLFSEIGFDKASIRMIAKEVGIRESAIYNHFQSKKEILDELVSDGLKHIEASNFIDDLMLENLTNPQEFFELFIDKIIDKWINLDERMFIKLLIQTKFNSSVKTTFNLDDFFDGVRSVLRIVIQELQTYNYLKKYDVELMIDQFISPLVVLKFRLLINDFFDTSLVKKKSKEQAKLFWEAFRVEND